MATSPTLPFDEAPLDAATVDLLLSNMGVDMVLVGGQALAFWMDRYGINPDGVAISNDGDVLGNIARAHDLAAAMRASVLTPPKRAMTSLVGQIRVPVDDGKVRNIDVLHRLFTVSGLRKSTDFTNQVIQDSVKVEWRPGRFIRVMDPIDVLESRVQNAVGLFEDKGPHVLTQALWAIEVAKAVLLKLARNPQEGERLGTKLQRIYQLANSQPGKRLLKEHQIEVLDAVDRGQLRTTAASHAQQLDKLEALAVARRKTAARKLAP
ncbi:hypothetical protein VAR608DRAFT_0218 [Variovorax sp. HW608]|uniref:hypothetical protein n=1 Tax=Variovorax sp. HW608 TaxID=1034889 RepID=UPI00081F9801|nr:hypothetical protein [Variovorax sp. HW608]SCK08155.1 hypothetical protein VAR608DRAFT_0218 [Variovorax sp. HW608]